MGRIRRSSHSCLILACLCGVLLAPIDARAQSCNCGIIPHCCPDMGQVDLTFSRTFQGGYRPGEPYDVLTIAPNGGFETLETVGIRLRIQIVCSCTGMPITGIPAQEMVLFSSSGCWCPAGNFAAHDTDADGWTEFTALRGGGCASSLTLFVDGVAIVTLPIKINSPDSSTGFGCAVDQSDLAAFATVLGDPARYSICFDYNESGLVDASDLAYFAALLTKHCE